VISYRSGFIIAFLPTLNTDSEKKTHFVHNKSHDRYKRATYGSLKLSIDKTSLMLAIKKLVSAIKSLVSVIITLQSPTLALEP